MESKQNSLSVPALAFTLLAAGCSGQASVPAPASTDVAAGTRVAPRNASRASYSFAGRLKIASGKSVDTFDVTQQIRTKPVTDAGHAITEYDGVETLTGKGTPLQTTFEADVAEIPSATRTGSDVTLEKFTSRDSTGVSQTTIYDAGNGVFDQVPGVPQARWSNTAARTESVADLKLGSSANETYRSDGSYDETAVPVEGRQATLHAYANGNAMYQWPYQGAAENSILTFSPPAAATLHVFFADAAAVPPHTISYDVGSWYPSTPPVLASDSFRNAGSVAIPSTCGVPKAYGRTAAEIDERVVRLDIVFGEYETMTRTRFVEAPYGLLCLEVHDDLKTYYRYQTTLNLSQKPLDETITDETLGLKRASIPKDLRIDGTTAVPLDARVIDSRDESHITRERDLFNVLAKMWSKS